MAYTALVLEEESRKILVKWLDSNHGKPEDWMLKVHHCTIDLKPINKSMAADLDGQRHEMRVVRFGRLDGIMAVEVETIVPSKNKRKHITLCHAKDVKPMMSNSIEEWHTIEPFVVFGVVKEVL